MARTGILFDLDGTLVDTAADLAWALNQALSSIDRGPLSEADVCAMIGGGIANLVSQGLEATGGAVGADEFTLLTTNCKTLYSDHVADRSRPYPGVSDALPALAKAGFGMGVCTNKPESASRRLLSALALDIWLPVVVGGDTLPVRKPDPAVARAVIERLGGTEQTVVLVGDSGTDVALARATGIPVVLVDYGYAEAPVKDLGADAVISNFAELSALLSALP